MAKKKAASQVAAVVSAVWVMLSILTDLVKIMKEFGLTIQEVGEKFYVLAQTESEGARRQIADIIAKVGEAKVGEKVLSLVEMIALGKYNWVKSGITAENFSVDQTAKWDEETRLFHFDRSMFTDAVKAEMDKEGWKPASIWNLLFFGMENPELQRQFPIIALGSVWRGDVPELFRLGSLRVLSLDRIGSDWDDNSHFLAVRK